jgi:hypothetical protein
LLNTLSSGALLAQGFGSGVQGTVDFNPVTSLQWGRQGAELAENTDLGGGQIDLRETRLNP